MKRNNMKPKNLDFIDSAYLNNATFSDYIMRLKRLSTSIFEWVNLPPTMDERYIEEVLFYDGRCALLYDYKKGYTYINTRCSTNGELNIYGLPTKINCYSYTYHSNRIVYNGLVTPDKNSGAVLVRNDNDSIPTYNAIELFAWRLYLCQRTLDVNIEVQKMPYIIQGTQTQVLSIKNLFSKIMGNQPLVITDKNSMEGVESIKEHILNPPFIADKITKEKKEIWNEVLTYLGINNIDIEKKERLTKGETNANNESINLNLQAFLIPRKLACEQFNKLMGLEGDEKIDVRVRSDLHNIIKQVMGVDGQYKTETDTMDALGLSYEVTENE